MSGAQRAGRLAAAIVGALLLTLLMPGPGGAQEESRSLTLADAARRALERHPSTAAARARRTSARAGVRKASASRLPTLSVRAGATRFQEPMVVTPIHGFTPGSAPPFDETLLDGGGHLTYTLWDGGGRGGRIRAARSRSEAVDASARASDQELLGRVAEVYLDALGARRVLEAHDRRLDALDAERDRVLDFLEVGRAAEVERLRVESAVAAAEAHRVALAAELDVAVRTLARLAGLAPGELAPGSLVPPGRVDAPLPRPATLYRTTARSNPELGALRRGVEGAEASLSVTRSARWPRVELGAQYVARGSDDHAPVAEWNAGLQLSVPVFTGGAVSGRIEQAEAERDEARARVRMAELDLEDAVDRAAAAVWEARARQRSLRSAVEGAREVARIERLRLETGEGVQSEYLDAEAALLDVRAGLARARYGELTARTRLARVTGTLTPEWIEETLGGER